MGKLIAICRSERKGTQKTEIEEAVLRVDHGMEGDAHAGNWHRQISLLALEKIEEFRQKGVNVEYGAFGENLVTEGFDLRNIPVGTRIQLGETLLELTQIGKECHDHCAIYEKTGDCIMPREGVFARVLKGGPIHKGDEMELLPLDPNRPFTAAIITLSDRAYRKEREDKSGPLIKEILQDKGYEVLESLLLPDGKPALKQALIRLADQRQINLILTTGGTGFSERDVTPEATAEVCDRMAPGIAEAMRAESMKITCHAMLSRQTAGIRKKSLIVNLPGSPKACREDLDIILPALSHGLGVLRGSEDS
ncbi:MAG: MOSC domain-containing protein [Lachnospiraceae bacterium]|nr:MOSC domain-containing protein [Lachnospiraceae bacterium]